MSAENSSDNDNKQIEISLDNIKSEDEKDELELEDVVGLLDSESEQEEIRLDEIQFLEETTYLFDKEPQKMSNQQVHFSFPTQSLNDELIPTTELPGFNSLPSVQEPSHGLYIPGFDSRAYEKKRTNINFVNFVPNIFWKQIRPLRHPSQIPPDEQLYDPSILKKIKDKKKMNRISLMSFTNLRLTQHNAPTLLRQINRFQNLEVLILRGSNLKSVSALKLPNLRICDLRQNNIINLRFFVMFLQSSPFLEFLDLTQNPIENNKDFWNTILVKSQRLMYLNGTQITVEARIFAIRAVGNRNLKSRIPEIRWDLTLCSLPSVRAMSNWAPESIVHLNFSNLQLQVFYVGTFKSLQVLDLSNNQITTLQKAGLEQCDKLNTLNLRNNLLKDLKNDVLMVLPYCPSLQVLFLDGNEIKDYRAQVIYACRNLKGTNRQPGLAVLDEQNVTSEEYLSSLEMIGRLPKNQIEEYRWMLAQFKIFGNYQVQQLDTFRDRITVASFAGYHLGYASVGKVEGLSSLTSLRLLDLSNNPHLDLKHTLGSLSEVTTLEVISFASDMVSQLIKKPSRKNLLGTKQRLENHHKKITEELSMFNQEYRDKVLKALLYKNPGLSTLDAQAITYEERVLCYEEYAKKKKRIQQSDIEAYKFALAVTLSSIVVPHERAKILHPKNLGQLGTHFDVTQITNLTRLSGIGISEKAIDLSKFPNLEYLNLSNNNIRSILGLGLERLKRLKAVDFSNNQIQDNLDDIGKLLDNMRWLEVLCLRGNPNMRTLTDRKKLLANIPGLKDNSCALKIVDYEISIFELVEVWRQMGVSEDFCEQMRFGALFRLKNKQGMEFEKVKQLDLSESKIETIDLTSFVNLEKLALRYNEISNVKNIKGLEDMKEMKALDLRYNKITRMKTLSHLTRKFTKLIAFGAAGNPFEMDKKSGLEYRVIFIASLTQLQNFKCPLKQLDGEEISVDEIIGAWKSTSFSSIDYESYRFNANIQRRYPSDLTSDQIEELNLTNCNISTMDFSPFKRLKKLSLRGNKITDRDLVSSNILTLKLLEQLDLRENKLRDLSVVAQIIDQMENLSWVYVDGNPAFTNDTPDLRVRFLCLIPSSLKPDSKLEALNGSRISVQERSASISLQKKEKDSNENSLEEYRFQMVVKKLRLDPETTTQIFLARYELKRISGISIFQKLEVLDISSNMIDTLEGQNLHTLPVLRSLDLRQNRFSSLASMLGPLSQIASLRELMIQNSTVKSETSKVESYLSLVCLRLRGLEVLDGKINPHPLDQDNWENLEKLSKLTGGRGGNPNSISDIDLSNGGFEPELFDAVLQCLKELPVKRLKMNKNGWERVSQYRFRIVHEIPLLKVLDDLPVSIAQRANALELAQKGKLKVGKDRTGVIATGVGVGFSGALMTGGGNDQNPTANIAGDGANQVNQQVGNSANNDNFPEMDGLKSGLSDIRNTAVSKAEFLRPTGTPLTKLEIFVNFFQILGLLVTLVDRSFWPKAFLKMSWVTLPFSVDIDFLILAFDINIPLTMHSKRERWEKWYVKKWTRTKIRLLIAWLLMLIIVCVIAIVIDIPSVKNDHKLTQTQISVIAVFCSIITFVVLLFFINAAVYRKHSKSDHYWYTYAKYKNRLALFFFTVLYMPIARAILYNFKCDSDTDKLSSFPDQDCPHSIKDFNALQWISIIFMPIYIVGIPIFFIRVIHISVREVNHSFGISNKMDEINELKKLKDPKLKSTIKRKTKEANKAYAVAVRKYKCAQSYLYSGYSRKFRYYKSIQMIEKFLLLLLALFFILKVRAIGAVVVSVLFTLFALITRPFSDSLESVMDDFSRVVNSLNIVGGLMLVFKVLPDSVAAVILVLINAIGMGGMFLMTVFSPLRSYCLNIKIKDILEKEAQEMDEIKGKVLHSTFDRIDMDDLDQINLDQIDNTQNLIKSGAVTGLNAADDAVDLDNIDIDDLDNIDVPDDAINLDDLDDLDDLDILDNAQIPNNAPDLQINLGDLDQFDIRNLDDAVPLDDLDDIFGDALLRSRNLLDNARDHIN
ncbi:leucine rich repeat protein [Anaeramoeba ignava]|uniref:Leucine rich repeat protein n=1 Tax=Anaeramoeba ignava TaxID=1746090 RepID=A0A9Q0LAT2_ANAIG|nr:leucine rich repeat protein [Anaeramoeba ignava]